MICSNIGLNLPRSSVYFVLLTRVSIVTRDIDMANLSVRLSVRPSVCPLRSGILWKQLNILFTSDKA